MDSIEEQGKRVIREAEMEMADRANFEQFWTEIARRVHTREDMFQGRNVTPGTRRSEWQFDSTAALALERCAAVQIAMNMPPSEFYHGLQAEDKAIRKDMGVKKWCEDTRDELFQMRYSANSNFGGNLNEVMMDAQGFGTGFMMIEDAPGRPVNYRSCGLHATY